MRNVTIEQMLQKEVQRIAEEKEVQGILLTGAGARADKEELERLNDVDLLVITAKDLCYQREISQRDGIRVDVSYLSLALLNTGLTEKWPWLLEALIHSKILFQRGDALGEILKKGARIYSSGPRALEDLEIRYLRFSLHQSFLDLMARQADPLNSAFLAHNLLREALVSYFKLNKMWVPKDKKILDAISKTDFRLYELCRKFLESQRMEQKLLILENILNHILKPFGGFLDQWEKGEFPIN